MRTRRTMVLLSITLLAVSALACGIGGERPQAPVVTEEPTEEPPVEVVTEEPVEEPTEVPPTEVPPADDDGGDYDTVFPLPDDVQNFIPLGEGAEGDITFQTSMSLEEVAEFYRQAFEEQGLTEREITTVVSEEVVNLVFDGSENGMAISVQAIPLGDLTNVAIGYRDV